MDDFDTTLQQKLRASFIAKFRPMWVPALNRVRQKHPDKTLGDIKVSMQRWVDEEIMPMLLEDSPDGMGITRYRAHASSCLLWAFDKVFDEWAARTAGRTER